MSVFSDTAHKSPGYTSCPYCPYEVMILWVENYGLMDSSPELRRKAAESDISTHMKKAHGIITLAAQADAYIRKTAREGGRA